MTGHPVRPVANDECPRPCGWGIAGGRLGNPFAWGPDVSPSGVDKAQTAISAGTCKVPTGKGDMWSVSMCPSFFPFLN